MKVVVSCIKEDLEALRERPTIFCFLRRLWVDPSFLTLTRWRVSCELRNGGALRRLISKMLWRRNVTSSGCFLSSKAKVGPGFVFPHAAAIVVGDSVEIGTGVVVYQNVTLGRRSETDSGYPIIGDGVRIYAGACIVGACRVGDNAVIAANAVVTKDVPSGAIVGGIPARILRDGRPSSFEAN